MTKNEILSSILPLASKEGLRNLSLSKIAENAGIAKSTLYSHFTSKDHMIKELYLYLWEKAKEGRHIGLVDYGKIVRGKTLKEVLTSVFGLFERFSTFSTVAFNSWSLFILWEIYTTLEKKKEHRHKRRKRTLMSQGISLIRIDKDQ